jgi:hypothetical protein
VDISFKNDVTVFSSSVFPSWAQYFTILSAKEMINQKDLPSMIIDHLSEPNI